MFLYLCKLINKSDSLVKNGKFREKKLLPNFFEIFEKNILIIGFGRIGKALAKRCLGFDSKVYVYDPYIDSSIIKENKCESIDLIDGFKIADEDMKLRGFGDILGFKQSGIKNFKIADPIHNNDLFVLAEKEIKKIEKENKSISKYKTLLKIYDQVDIINDII